MSILQRQEGLLILTSTLQDKQRSWGGHEGSYSSNMGQYHTSFYRKNSVEKACLAARWDVTPFHAAAGTTKQQAIVTLHGACSEFVLGPWSISSVSGPHSPSNSPIPT